MNRTAVQQFHDNIATACGVSDGDERRVCEIMAEEYAWYATRNRPLTVKERQRAEEKIRRRTTRRAVRFGIIEPVVASIIARIAVSFFMYVWGRLFDEGGEAEVQAVCSEMN